MNLSTVKWAQWDKTHSRELLGPFICVCIAPCTIVAHDIAQNRPDNFPSYPPDNHHCSDDVYLRDAISQPKHTYIMDNEIYAIEIMSNDKTLISRHCHYSSQTLALYCKYNTCTVSFSMASIMLFAFSTFSFRPVIVITSLSLFSRGKSIFVSVSSRILRTCAPPLPMIFGWTSFETRTLASCPLTYYTASSHWP